MRQFLKSTARIAITTVLPALAAHASPATRNELGFEATVVNVATVSTVQITLRPQRAFAEVTLEAGSGVESFTPACRFATVSAGSVYHCRIDVTGRAGDAAMTLRMLATHPKVQGALLSTELHQVSIANPDFVRSATPAPASKHALRPAQVRKN